MVTLCSALEISLVYLQFTIFFLYLDVLTLVPRYAGPSIESEGRIDLTYNKLSFLNHFLDCIPREPLLIKNNGISFT